ncbi:MAG: cell division protein SepF [Bacillota bacterium]
MTFMKTLTSGEIGKKQHKNTPYDDFMAEKQLAVESFNNVSITVLSPTTFADIEALIVELKKCHGLVIDLKKAKVSDQQRMLDFMSGAVFALDGKLERIKDKIFLMTPKGVKLKANI